MIEDDIKRLNELAESFRRMNNKFILLRLVQKAQSEYDKYDYDSAKKSLLEAYKIDKTNPSVLRGLGCIKQFNGNFKSAIIFFKKALEYSKKKEVEYTLIGMAYYLQDHLDEAVKYFNLAINENDTYERAYEGRNQAMLENHLRLADIQDSLKKHF